MQYEKNWETTKLIREATKRLGIHIEQDDSFTLAGKLVWPDGFSSYWASSSFGINTSGSSRVSKDKKLTQFFMQNLGVPVVEPSLLYRDPISSDEVSKILETLPFPFVVKPNDDSLARGVTCVTHQDQLLKGIEKAREQSKNILFQRYIQGDVFRVAVLDGVVQFVLQKGPFQQKGIRVDIHDLAEKFKKAAIDATVSIGLRWAGVDIIIDGNHTDENADFVVLEVNSSPALRHYAAISAETHERTIQTIINILQAIHPIS